MHSHRYRLVVGLIPLPAMLLSGCGSPTASTTPRGQSPAHATASPVPPINLGGSTATLQDSYVAVVKRVRPSVVQIETQQGLGSGIVFDGAGNIVTNAHVVEGATAFTVTFSDGKKHQGTLVGTFPVGDLAVIHVGGTVTAAPATFADSAKLEVGDITIAIGNPLGLSSSVTNGIVSAVGRTVSEGNGFVLPDVIQTSAAINPGNSGGALVDLGGNVIGIPTLAATDAQLGGAAPGIGFAIPSNTVTDIAQQLIAHGRVIASHRAYLGIRGTLADGGGVLIVSVTASGPAAHAGLQAGDVVTSMNGKDTPNIATLNELLAPLAPGQKATLAVTRGDGSTVSIAVTLGELPGS